MRIERYEFVKIGQGDVCCVVKEFIYDNYLFISLSDFIFQSIKRRTSNFLFYQITISNSFKFDSDRFS